MQKVTYTIVLILGLSGCVSQVPSGIKTLCKELPTVSEKDTTQTIIEVDNFNAKFKAYFKCR